MQGELNDFCFGFRLSTNREKERGKKKKRKDKREKKREKREREAFLIVLRRQPKEGGQLKEGRGCGAAALRLHWFLSESPAPGFKGRALSQKLEKAAGIERHHQTVAALPQRTLGIRDDESPLRGCDVIKEIDKPAHKIRVALKAGARSMAR